MSSPHSHCGTYAPSTCGHARALGRVVRGVGGEADVLAAVADLVGRPGRGDEVDHLVHVAGGDALSGCGREGESGAAPREGVEHRHLLGDVGGEGAGDPATGDAQLRALRLLRQVGQEDRRFGAVGGPFAPFVDPEALEAHPVGCLGLGDDLLPARTGVVEAIQIPAESEPQDAPPSFAAFARFAASSCRLALRTLPVGVIGNSSRKTRCWGYMYLVTFCSSR